MLDVIAVLLVRSAELNRTFWGWTRPEWVHLLGRDQAEFRRHAPVWAGGEVRPYLAAHAHLLGGFSEFHLLGSFQRLTLSWRIFGRDRVNGEITRVRAVLSEWGHQLGRDDDSLLPMVICQLFLFNRSPHLEDLTTGLFDRFRSDRLISIKENPIQEITPAGVRTADGVEHELDTLVFATGFDAVDGNYRAMDLRGRGGRHINDHWTDGPTSYLGVSKAGFPNMFMILGPNGPFTNLPPSIEAQVDWIGALIGDTERNGVRTVEPTQAAEDGWTATCEEIANMTLFPQAESWIFGANIPGKTNAVMFYMAGIGAYRQKLAEVAENGYEGFEQSKQNETAGV